MGKKRETVDPKVWMLRAIADLREYKAKKELKHFYSLIASVDNEIKANEFNRVMLGRINDQDEKLVRKILKAFETLENFVP